MRPASKKAEAQQAQARPDSRLRYKYRKLGFLPSLIHSLLLSLSLSLQATLLPLTPSERRTQGPPPLLLSSVSSSSLCRWWGVERWRPGRWRAGRVVVPRAGSGAGPYPAGGVAQGQNRRATAALLASGAEQSGSPPALPSPGRGGTDLVRGCADLLLRGSRAADPALVQQIQRLARGGQIRWGAARGHHIRWGCGSRTPDLVVVRRGDAGSGGARRAAAHGEAAVAGPARSRRAHRWAFLKATVIFNRRWLQCQPPLIQ
jgi:hypothetical protein